MCSVFGWIIKITASRSIMFGGSISLRVGNLKGLKMGYQQSNFYLALHSSHGDQQVTACKNILFQEEPFEVENLHSVSKIEVWNYDSRKRIATLHLRSEAAGKHFQYEFKKHNMNLAITWKDPLPSLIDVLRCSSDKSDSEESRSTDHNISSEEDL